MKIYDGGPEIVYFELTGEKRNELFRIEIQTDEFFCSFNKIPVDNFFDMRITWQKLVAFELFRAVND